MRRTDARDVLRRAGAGILGCAALGVGLLGGAMRLYPGGTWQNPAAIGHSFWRNFLCDLTQPVAIGGAPNQLGAALGTAGEIGLFAAAALAFVVAAHAMPDGARKGSLGARLGTLGSCLACAVPVLPSRAWPALHSVAIVVAGIPGLTGLVLTTCALVRAPRAGSAVRALTAAFAAAALVHGAWWAFVVAFGAPHAFATAALPAVQKGTGVVFLAWLGSLARFALTSTSADPP
jgi:hypothetical protein